ncbi:MAG TPA: YdeI/OmpD-associated family protein, partial [Candidatus Angelobacter sp.]|nr:YdeI/OmpD-associated family protein [Candidatus Angelobacter sp.]
MPAAKTAVKTFDAVLEHSGNSLNWIIIRVPFNVFKVWGTRAQIKVTGEINGFAFRSALFPTRAGVHFLIVNKRMQAGGKAQAGVKARFRLQPDTAPRELAPPAEFVRVLGQSKRLQKYYLSLNDSTQRWIAKWIADSKQAATRVRRSEQMAERLFETMEAERELPPLLQITLAQNPKARA